MSTYSLFMLIGFALVMANLINELVMLVIK